MKPKSTVLYELSFSEIKALPINYTVIQRNKVSGAYRLLKAHIIITYILILQMKRFRKPVQGTGYLWIKNL